MHPWSRSCQSLTFVLLTLILGGVGCSNRERTYKLHVRFEEPQELKIGDPVFMSYDPIGRVESILSDPLGPGYVVTMEIKQSETVKLDATVVSQCQRSIFLIAG